MRGMLITLLLALPFTRGADCANADEELSDVTVRVRAVKAEGAVRHDGGTPAAASVDQRLSDLQAKLAHLPYASFHLLSARSVPVLLRKKTTIHLDGGQLLNVRLLYANDERIGMWVRWSDKDGVELLDTRMHFRCDEPMLTGTDNTADSALILALDVERSNVPPGEK